MFILLDISNLCFILAQCYMPQQERRERQIARFMLPDEIKRISHFVDANRIESILKRKSDSHEYYIHSLFVGLLSVDSAIAYD